MFDAESEPAAAVTAPGVMVRADAGIVRDVVSTVPASLVKSVALTDSVHGAPVPRASVMLHSLDAVPVAVWVPLPFRVTPESVAPEVVCVRLPPDTTELVVSAIAGDAARASTTHAPSATSALLVVFFTAISSVGTGWVVGNGSSGCGRPGAVSRAALLER